MSTEVQTAADARAKLAGLKFIGHGHPICTREGYLQGMTLGFRTDVPFEERAKWAEKIKRGQVRVYIEDTF